MDQVVQSTSAVEKRRGISKLNELEPTIGHMKADGKLRRNWLKGALDDAIHAVLCGAGHNLRMILRKLRLFYLFIRLVSGWPIGTSQASAFP